MPRAARVVFWPDLSHIVSWPKRLAADAACFPRKVWSDELAENYPLAAFKSAHAFVHHDLCNRDRSRMFNHSRIQQERNVIPQLLFFEAFGSVHVLLRKYCSRCWLGLRSV